MEPSHRILWKVSFSNRIGQVSSYYVTKDRKLETLLNVLERHNKTEVKSAEIIGLVFD